MANRQESFSDSLAEQEVAPETPNFSELTENLYRLGVRVGSTADRDTAAKETIEVFADLHDRWKKFAQPPTADTERKPPVIAALAELIDRGTKRQAEDLSDIAPVVTGLIRQEGTTSVEVEAAIFGRGAAVGAVGRGVQTLTRNFIAGMKAA